MGGPLSVAPILLFAAAGFLGPFALSGLTLVTRRRRVVFLLLIPAATAAGFPALFLTVPAVVSGDLWAEIDPTHPGAADDGGWQQLGRVLVAANLLGWASIAAAAVRGVRLTPRSVAAGGSAGPRRPM